MPSAVVLLRLVEQRQEHARPGVAVEVRRARACRAGRGRSPRVYIATLQRTLFGGPLTIGRSMSRAGTTTRVATRSAGIAGGEGVGCGACRAAGSSAGRATASGVAVTTISVGLGRRRRLDGAGVRQQAPGDQRHADGGQDGREEAIANAAEPAHGSGMLPAGRLMRLRDPRTGTLPPHEIRASRSSPACSPACSSRARCSWASCSSGRIRSRATPSPSGSAAVGEPGRLGRRPAAIRRRVGASGSAGAPARRAASAVTENFHVGEPAPALVVPQVGGGDDRPGVAARQAGLGQLHADDLRAVHRRVPADERLRGPLRGGRPRDRRGRHPRGRGRRGGVREQPQRDVPARARQRRRRPSARGARSGCRSTTGSTRRASSATAPWAGSAPT